MEGLFAAVFVRGDEFLADTEVLATHTEAGVTTPRQVKRHNVGERAGRIEEGSAEDNQGPIGGSILEPHNDISIGCVFPDHFDSAQGWSNGEGDKAGGCVQHHVSDRCLADGADLPLSVPDCRIHERMQEAHVVVAAIAPLYLSVAGIVLTLDISEYRSFDGVADIRGHKAVAVAPAAEFADRIEVVLDKRSVQGVPGSGLGPEIKGVHDAGVKE